MEKLELKVNGCSISDSSEVCEAFNDFFSKIGKNLADKIPKSNSNPLSNINRLEPSIFLNPANEIEVFGIINELDANKSSGPDNLPTSVVKANINIFSNIFAQLFNQILEQGIYPECLKVAKVTPVFKSGEASDPSNFRPISTI